MWNRLAAIANRGAMLNTEIITKTSPTNQRRLLAYLGHASSEALQMMPDKQVRKLFAIFLRSEREREIREKTDLW